MRSLFISFLIFLSAAGRAAEIGTAIQRAAAQDTAAGIEPLNAGELLSHFANRFGFGVSSNDPVWVPDKIDAAKIPAMADILNRHLARPVTGIYVAPIQKALHKALYADIELRIRNSIPGFALRPSIRSVFTAADGSVNLVDYSQTALASAKAPIIDEANNGATLAIRLRAKAEISAIRQLLRRALLFEPLVHQAFGSIVGDNRRDVQINLTRVLSEFWFNHFNIDIDKSFQQAGGTTHYENLIIAHQHSTFQQMLSAVIKSPAMLFYLDNNQNKWEGTKPSNQNLGRELLELHTFGAGPRGATTDLQSPYNQYDVEVASTILTGHNVRQSPTYAGYYFWPNRHFPDSFVTRFWNAHPAARPLFFNLDKLQQLDGSAANGRLDLALSWLATHPLTKKNICQKLTQRFILNPDRHSVTGRCIQAYGNNGALTAMYTSIVESPEIWRRANFRSIMKNPHEMVLSRLRNLGLSDKSFQNSNGVIVPERVLATFDSLRAQIEQHGLEYRAYGDPTGYEMIGARWLSTGYLIAHVRHGFELTHLDRILDVHTQVRNFTTDPATLQRIAGIAALPDAGLADAVRQILFGDSVASSLTSRIRREQAEEVRSVVQTGATAADFVDLNGNGTLVRSVPDSVLGRSFLTRSSLQK